MGSKVSAAKKKRVNARTCPPIGFDVGEYAESGISEVTKKTLQEMRALKILRNGQKPTASHFKQYAELKAAESEAVAAVNMARDVAVVAANRSKMIAMLEQRLSDPNTKDSAFSGLMSTWHKVAVAPIAKRVVVTPGLEIKELGDDEIEAIGKEFGGGE